MQIDTRKKIDQYRGKALPIHFDPTDLLYCKEEIDIFILWGNQLKLMGTQIAIAGPLISVRNIKMAHIIFTPGIDPDSTTLCDRYVFPLSYIKSMFINFDDACELYLAIERNDGSLVNTVSLPEESMDELGDLINFIQEAKGNYKK
ncbi:MAG: hypothetical protein ACXITV_01755 [Luteibaculaceae bacterium]